MVVSFEVEGGAEVSQLGHNIDKSKITIFKQVFYVYPTFLFFVSEKDANGQYGNNL